MMSHHYFPLGPAARQFLLEDGAAYDVIYMDAYLPPSTDTDPTGAPTGPVLYTGPCVKDW